MTLRRNVPALLLQDMDNLGEVGDVVQVRPGYARNYLFPRGLATPVTADALQRVEKRKQIAAQKRAKRAAQVAELASRLEGLSILLEERAGDEGHLFGSVGVATVVAALREQGIEVSERQVDLAAPIKELGIYSIPIRLDAERSADVRLWIVAPSE